MHLTLYNTDGRVCVSRHLLRVASSCSSISIHHRSGLTIIGIRALLSLQQLLPHPDTTNTRLTAPHSKEKEKTDTGRMHINLILCQVIELYSIGSKDYELNHPIKANKEMNLTNGKLIEGET